MVFYRSFYEAAKDLPEENRLRLYEVLFEYAMNDTEPDLVGVESACFKLMKPQIDANARRLENGRLGGRPKTKLKPNYNQTITSTKPNVNVNDNANGNDNVSGSSRNSDVSSLSDQVINYLNSKTGSSYETDNDTTDMVLALTKQGYDLDDMKRVIDKKSSEWLGDNLMAHYLRPSTLFGSKFKEYLQAPEPRQAEEAKPVVDTEALQEERQEKSDELELIQSRIHELNQTKQSVIDNQPELADLRLQEEITRERIEFIDKRLEGVT